jgi:hypothetical protein
MDISDASCYIKIFKKYILQQPQKFWSKRANIILPNLHNKFFKHVLWPFEKGLAGKKMQKNAALQYLNICTIKKCYFRSFAHLYDVAQQ